MGLLNKLKRRFKIRKLNRMIKAINKRIDESEMAVYKNPFYFYGCPIEIARNRITDLEILRVKEIKAIYEEIEQIEKVGIYNGAEAKR